MKVYCYSKCSTCRKALNWLDEKGISYETLDIKENHPSFEELKAWYGASGLPLKKFFNTSGMLYKELKLKDKLPEMTEEEQLKLLSTDGMLVKRPLVIGEDFVLTGFKEEDWKEDAVMEAMDRQSQLAEIREAIEVGQKTLNHLAQARKELDAASGFGIADMLGFDLIGGIGKHAKMARAEEQIRMAKAEVMNFQRELADVKGHLNFSIDLGTFLTFADFLFDGIFADLFVQSKIEDAKSQVDNAVAHIRPIMTDLYRMEEELR